MLAKYPRADLFIVLEEDIKVSPDFFSPKSRAKRMTQKLRSILLVSSTSFLFRFLNRTAKLLKEDPSLHCVSAHNDLSYPGTSRDPRALLRAASYTNYGWMVRECIPFLPLFLLSPFS
ncbi:protein O-linked-mannose beta-1,2-N-acetylglucosaminyltransferase 1-like [Scylla paramamosain]|uniref:protein O-linked-mannose beta-1,2-N-acetylglucosaminyltransferase 1-like n=1 Tax=Scylla paramamosain TaxID=85552 RepID=UPI0030830D28